jgi:uncharacterized protein YbjT (DUF2867 family)
MQFYLPPVPTAVNVAKSVLLLPMKNARLSPVDIEDIAKVAFALLHSEGHESKSYDMTGPEALTMTEVAERISQEIGKPFRYVNISMEETRQTWLAAGIPSDRAYEDSVRNAVTALQQSNSYQDERYNRS